jgi:hypothetical protein
MRETNVVRWEICCGREAVRHEAGYPNVGRGGITRELPLWPGG